MTAGLAGGVAVVTGAGSGLGAALAGALAGAGMRLAVADIDAANAERVASALADAGREARAFPVDVGDLASVAALAAATARALGPCRVLCANVGVQQLGRLEALDPADCEWVLRVNVLGTLACVRAYLPQLRRAGGERRILITASTSALYAVPRIGIYTASKYAVLGLAETLRLELAEEGIGVCALLPGPMATSHLASSAAAKPAALGSPAFTPDDVTALTRAMDPAPEDVVAPEHAARHAVRDLLANRPYIATHDVHGAAIEARLAALREAFRRARE